MPLVRKTGASPPTPPPPSRAALFQGTREERWAAARALTQASDVALLGEALGIEEDVSVREAILTSLCRIATPECAAVIIPGVRSDNASIRRGALDALISMPQAAQPHLAALLHDRDVDVRVLTCEVVRALPSDEATKLLCDLLNAEQVANVCTAAVDLLTEVGGAEALDTLRTVSARFENEPFLQFAIAAAIERISTPSDINRG